MSSPFLGLSILVHVCVIFAHKLFAPILNLRTRREVAVVAEQTCIASSMIIMVGMTGIVMSGAVSIVYTSVTDEYSTIQVVQRYFEQAPISGTVFASESARETLSHAASQETNTSTSAFALATEKTMCNTTVADGNQVQAGYGGKSGMVKGAEPRACQFGTYVFNYSR